MTPKEIFYEKQAHTIIKKLETRNMEAYYCKTGQEAKEKALSLIPDGSVVSWGGSQTLVEIDLLNALKDRTLELIDRSLAKTNEEIREAYIKAFDVDYYLMSSNAITLDGKLVNIDGNGNRLAALIYGPKNVIVIVGMNKVVEDEEAAIWRIRNIATPQNAIRLGYKPPCSENGRCYDCQDTDCLCCQIVTTRRSRQPKRIKVILVGESLGY